MSNLIDRSSGRVRFVIGALALALIGGLAWSVLLTPSAHSSTAADRIGLLQRSPSGLGSFNRGRIGSSDWATRVGVDPGQARAADTGGSGWHVWLATGGSQACVLFAPDGALGAGAACGSLADVVNGDLSVTVAGGGDNPGVTLIGIVPDGVDTVDVATDDGRTDNVKVRDNVFVSRTSMAASRYSFTGPDGDHAHTIAKEG